MERSLVVLTFRPHFVPSWRGPHITPLLLNRLAPAYAARLSRSTAGERLWRTSQVAEIVRRTDGIPLFVEELTKALLEQGASAAPSGARRRRRSARRRSIPATLQDLLAARLDRLGSAKEVAQLCATLGTGVLLRAARRGRAARSHDAARRVHAPGRRRAARAARAAARALYEFRHALIQEAAYHSLLKARRQRYHEHIGRVLEQRFPQVVETRPELVRITSPAGACPSPPSATGSAPGARARPLRQRRSGALRARGAAAARRSAALARAQPAGARPARRDGHGPGRHQGLRRRRRRADVQPRARAL